jgi:hypothetical protein
MFALHRNFSERMFSPHSCIPVTADSPFKGLLPEDDFRTKLVLKIEGAEGESPTSFWLFFSVFVSDYCSVFWFWFLFLFLYRVCFCSVNLDV